jgi:hypothetical protein
VRELPKTTDSCSFTSAREELRTFYGGPENLGPLTAADTAAITLNQLERCAISLWEILCRAHSPLTHKPLTQFTHYHHAISTLVSS